VYGRLVAADIQQEEDESGNTDSKRKFKFHSDPSPEKLASTTLLLAGPCDIE
jgi:hypothetical protein